MTRLSGVSFVLQYPVMKARVSEIFRSVQGEGRYAGVLQVFVRFFGCPIHCAWCDTPAAIGEGPGRFDEYGTEELADRVRILAEGVHSVSLTGGEPLQQVEAVSALLPALRSQGLPVHLETNGILAEALSGVLPRIDVIAMDIKLPSSVGCGTFWEEHEAFLDAAVAGETEVFIKSVVTAATEERDVDRAAALIARRGRGIVWFLQPDAYGGRSAVRRCLELQATARRRLDDVRVTPQMHKILRIP